MRYMLIHYLDQRLLSAWEDGDEQWSAEQDRALSEWDEEMTARGILVGGGGLAAPRSARTLRVRDGQVLVTDGPFAETREQVGGYSVLECSGLDQAIEVAYRHPAARIGTFGPRRYAGEAP